MAGINLSQSIQEKQAIARGSFFDKGFFINMTIFLLVAGIYGGSQWYLGTLEDELATLEGEVSLKTAGIKSEDTNQATDLSARLKSIAGSFGAGVEPADAFRELEQLTIADIKLTGYSYQVAEGGILINGVTTNLKYLAQQMLAYKKFVGVSAVHVEDVEYDMTGQIGFTLQLSITAPVETGFVQ